MIVGVDPEDILDRQVMIRPFGHSDLISGGQLSFDHNSQVCTGSQSLREVAWKLFIIHPHSKPPARHARFGDLEHDATDLPSLTDECLIYFYSFGREVFTKDAVRK